MKKTPSSAPDRIHFLPKIEIDLPDLDFDGLLLNLAHGGEDVIGKTTSAQVVAINISSDDLADSAPTSLRIIMNPCDLKFYDRSFDVVTGFFSMMYLVCNQQFHVFREVFRVLKPGGHFLFWEVIVPERAESEKDIIAFPVQIRTPKGTMSAGFGALWPDQAFTPDMFLEMAVSAGFVIADQTVASTHFFFDFEKPID